MRKMARRRPPKEFEILDVTDEVIRDYNGAETDEEEGHSNLSDRHAQGSNDSKLLSIDERRLVLTQRPRSFEPCRP
jgi:hypothetical protein